MSHRLFPIRPAAFTPEFRNFLARGFFNLSCPIAAYLLFGWARHMPEVLQGATYSTAGILTLVTVYLWAGTLRNFFRFHQFLYRIFKQNPFHDETTTRMLAVGVNQEQIYWNEEADYHNDRELYFRHWRTVGEIVKAVILFLPRLLLWILDKLKPPGSGWGSGSGMGAGTGPDSGSATKAEAGSSTKAESGSAAKAESGPAAKTELGLSSGAVGRPAWDKGHAEAEEDAEQQTTGIYSVAC